MSKIEGNPTMLLKIVFVGDAGVGKTSLLRREAEQVFTGQCLATIGVDFRIKTYQVGKVSAKVQLWDTAGQQRFRTISRNYYKGAHAICLCFDLNKRQTLTNLPKWLDQLRGFDIQAPIYLVGCKSDLDIEIPTDEILTFAEAYQVSYLQTSAKDNVGVNDSFRKIIEDSVQNNLINLAFNKQGQKIHGSIELKQEPVKKRSCTC